MAYQYPIVDTNISIVELQALRTFYTKDSPITFFLNFNLTATVPSLTSIKFGIKVPSENMQYGKGDISNGGTHKIGF